MEKILYCIDKSSKRKVSLPFPFDKTSKVKDISQKNFPIVVLEEGFLERRKKSPSFQPENKVYFIHFSSKDKNNVKLVKQYGFFSYFTDDETKEDVIFKFEQASKYLEFKNQLGNLENQLLKKDKKIEKIILADPLTGCYNWRYFLRRVHVELSRSRRQLHSVSCIGIDIDHFRQINEVYGVKVADTVIKELVSVLKVNLRKEDVLVRWREDEFFIIAPCLERKDVQRAAERIRDRIALRRFKYKNLILSIKASIGVVTSPEDNIFSTRDVVNALERCILRAKRRGGNTVALYSPKQHVPSPKRVKKISISELRGKIEKMDTVLTQNLLDMIYGFARAIEAKDYYTGKHVEYTAAIAKRIAENLNLSESEVENVKRAAVLHDLGKVGIEGSILSKKGRLTPKEREVIKTHPSIAAEILREIRALRGAIPAILYHHERYDGEGYPLGLKGEEIPLSARIVAIADVYQALISDRPYRKAYKREKALEIISKEAGKQFDPKIVKLFLEVIKELEADAKL